MDLIGLIFIILWTSSHFIRCLASLFFLLLSSIFSLQLSLCCFLHLSRLPPSSLWWFCSPPPLQRSPSNWTWSSARLIPCTHTAQCGVIIGMPLIYVSSYRALNGWWVELPVIIGLVQASRRAAAPLATLRSFLSSICCGWNPPDCIYFLLHGGWQGMSGHSLPCLLMAQSAVSQSLWLWTRLYISSPQCPEMLLVITGNFPFKPRATWSGLIVWAAVVIILKAWQMLDQSPQC